MTHPLLMVDDDVGGYAIQNSVRSRGGASAYWSRTNKNVVTINNVWTWSGWRKLGALTNSNVIVLYGTGAPGSTDECTIKFQNNQLEVINYVSGNVQARRVTNAVKRDPSNWYHICVSSNGASGLSIEFNGLLETSFATSVGPSAAAWALNTASVAVRMGAPLSGTFQYFDGLQAEDIFVDGQALSASNFGEFDSVITTWWKPKKYTGTYGLNGGYWPYTDNSALTTSSNAGLGKDFSGNGNYWTTNNISLTAGVTYDSMTDVPTLTSASAANFAVLNPLSLSSAYVNLSNGNLTVNKITASTQDCSFSTIGVSTGRVYWEVVPTSFSYLSVTVSTGTSAPSTYGRIPVNNINWQYSVGIINNAGAILNGTGYSANDVLGFDLDCTGNTLAFYKNGTLIYTLSGVWAALGISGVADLFAGTAHDSADNYATVHFNFGQRPFAFTPPSGSVALNTYNLPDSSIPSGKKHMDVLLRAGTGSISTINSYQFDPEIVLSKARNNIRDSYLADILRGVNKALMTDLASAENTTTNGLTAFIRNGYTLGSSSGDSTAINLAADNYVDFAWKAGGAGVTNTAGTITSQVSANPIAGCSIVRWTGNGVAGATIGHGLGIPLGLILVKAMSAGSTSWLVYHSSLGNGSALFLERPDPASASSGWWNNTSPTSSVFSVGSTSYNNQSGVSYVAYCFAPISGYSAFGAYQGNSIADGAFLNVGFKPRLAITKATTTVSGGSWVIVDSARNPNNVVINTLLADSSGAEFSYVSPFDFLSNALKVRSTWDTVNASGATYIYAMFAESPFKYANAR